MKKVVLVLLGALAVIIFIAQRTGALYVERHLRMWQHTPAWELARAVYNQDTWSIERIAKKDPDLLNYQRPDSGSTVLIFAVGMEKYRSAKALLRCGADPNLATKTGQTALFVASGSSWVDRWPNTNPKYVKLLLKYKADPNICYQSLPGESRHDIIEVGTSPLIYSINHSLAKTKALVEGGADINHKTASGATAAIEALQNHDHPEYAYYLIVEKRANVTESYFQDERLIRPGDIPKIEYPADLLQYWHQGEGEPGYEMKMKILQEFQRQWDAMPIN